MDFDILPEAKPFVKWAGGKSQLLAEVQQTLPSYFSTLEDVVYVEPFVGGGAVLFWMLQRYSNIHRAVINDINPDLINVYQNLKSDPHAVIAALRTLQNDYWSLDESARKTYFLQQRTIFNHRQGSQEEQAALFIFLNKTCFNGLYRVNGRGDFNVPHGRYTRPKICDEENLLAVSALLQKVEILCGDFSQTLSYASKNTLFYLDPPYKPLNETSSFTAYAKYGFDDEEQLRVARFAHDIAQQGAMLIASNSDPQTVDPHNDFFLKAYDGFQIRKVYATRMINAKADRRGKLSELMITNIP